MGVEQAEDAQQEGEEEGVIEEECEGEVEEEEEVGCSSLVNCGQCISHPGCVYCRDPEFLLQERSPSLNLYFIPHTTPEDLLFLVFVFLQQYLQSKCPKCGACDIWHHLYAR